jgi:SAM-dependent methyltransferase
LIQFEIGDACELKYENESFDHVWFSFNGLDFIYPSTRRIQALKEAYRVLRPGGLFIYSSHNSLCILTLRPSRWRDIGRNLVSGDLFRPYRKLVSKVEGTTIIFHQHPLGQICTLKEIGFGQCDIVSSFDTLFSQTFSDSWPYYVAHKPI